MLNIYYGDLDREDYIFDPDTFFNNTYEDEWITDPVSARMIEAIDGSQVVGPHLIESPYLGPIPPERLSGGVKTLILINNDSEHIFNASACGDNCAKWLLKIGAEKDITIRLGYFMDFGQDSLQARVINTGAVVSNGRDLDREVIVNNLL